jgi:hypothetical protein
MAFETYKGTLIAPTVTGSQTTTGVPFQPKAVLFWCGCLTAPANTDVYLTCFGAATRDGGATQQWTIGNAENGGASSNAGRRAVNTACISMPLNGNYSGDTQANLTAFTSDGFTLNWSDAAATANMFVHYFAFGGSDLTNVKAGTHTIVRTTAGTEATTGLGFQPDLVLFGSAGVPSSGIVDATFCFGAARRSPSTQQFAFSFFENDAAATMDTFQRRSITKALVLPDSTSVLEAEAAISSFDASGFTLDWTDPVAVASSRVFYYLAFQGGQYELGVDSTPTAMGDRVVTTSFQPTGVFFGWLNRTMAVDTSVVSAGDAGYGVGAIDAAQNAGYAVINQTHADAASQSWRRQDSGVGAFGYGVWLLKGVRAAKQARAVGKSGTAFGATSFTLNWVTVDAAVYQYHYIAFGDSAGAAPAEIPFLVTARRA